MHLKEDIIEKFIIESNSLNQFEVEIIEHHLNECKKCLEVYHYFQNFYKNYQRFEESEPEQIDLSLANKFLYTNQADNIKLLTASSKNKLIKIRSIPITIKHNINHAIQSLIRIFKEKPVTGLSLTFTFLLLIGYSSTLLLNTIFQKPKPYYGINYNGIIKIYDAKDKLLWELKLNGIPNSPFDSLSLFDEQRSSTVKLIDINFDGTKELLVVASIYDNLERKYYDTLYCFNADGSLRWKTYPETEKFNYAPHWRRTEWQIVEFIPIKTKNGNKIVLIANDRTYAGNVISSIDPNSGEITSSIYNAGHTRAALLKDLDNDGFDEIIIGGHSTYYKPRLAVLKTDYFMGVLPDFYSENINLIKGNALYYILLPTTELTENYFKSGPFLVSDLKPFKQSNGITAITNEYFVNRERTGGLVFSFDKNFECKHISVTTYYSENYNKFYEQGIVKEKLTFEKLQKLKDKILYWDGDKFVNYPTMNKYRNQNFKIAEIIK